MTKVIVEEVYSEPSEITAGGGWVKNPGKGHQELLICVPRFDHVEGLATCVGWILGKGWIQEESSSISHIHLTHIPFAHLSIWIECSHYNTYMECSSI